MLTSFFLTDKFNGNIMGQTGFSADPAKDGNYVTNVSDPRPRVRWICGADTPAQHQNMRLFTVDNSNKYIEISATPSGAITTLTLTNGLYSAGELASHISTLLAATAFSDWSCSYLSVGKFLDSLLPLEDRNPRQRRDRELDGEGDGVRRLLGPDGDRQWNRR